jgi:hypothetical protein
MTLYDHTGSIVESNDDIDTGGRNYCAQITRTLAPGSYIVRIAPFDASGVGRYVVSVRGN